MSLNVLILIKNIVMIYICYILLSGILSGMVSIFFRIKELREKKILMHKQFFTQVAIFVVFLLIFKEFFTDVFIDLGFLKLGWISLYIIFSSFSYYMVQVFFEFFSGKRLFPTDVEIQDYIERLENKR